MFGVWVSRDVEEVRVDGSRVEHVYDVSTGVVKVEVGEKKVARGIVSIDF